MASWSGREARRRALCTVALLVLALGLAACGPSGPTHPTSTSTTPPTTTPSTTTIPSDLVVGRTTAIGDSVMLDYASALKHDRSHVVVDANVGRQWGAGITTVRQLRARHALGATVVIDLGNNGPVTVAAFKAMSRALRGVPRVVFVTVHVDQPWQASVNAVLRHEVPNTPGAVLADWATLARAHPQWFYPDATHLPINGAGAKALARLIARAAAPTPPKAVASRR